MDKKFEEWRDDIQHVADHFPEIVERGLSVGVRIVRAEAVANHLSGPKMARGVGDEKSATLQPDTGHLRASVQTAVEASSNKVSGKVFTNTAYAPAHEFGKGVPKRPFLAPSLDEKKYEAIEKVKDVIVEGLTHGG